MSFFTKYRLEFNDLKGTDWKVDFLEDAFAGTIINLKGQGIPLIFYFDNNSDIVYDPIHESHCEVNIWSMTNFILQDLYSTETMQYQVNIYADGYLYWWGYIDTQLYKEGYDRPPYRVTISCTDGLSLLNCPYEDWGGDPYTGRRFESQILLECLEKIGHTEFKEFVNLYEDNLNNTVDDSPFDQILIDVSVFKEKNCIEIIERILEKYNAVIMQKNGIFNIIRPKELIGVTVYGRYFTAYNTKTSITYSSLQVIKSIGYDSNRLQVPGGVVMVQSPIHEMKIKFNFGNKESWIENYQFNNSTYNFNTDSSLCNFDYWTNTGAVLVAPLSSLLAGETEGCLLVSQDTYPSHIRYISQTFANNAKTTNSKFGLEIDYMFYNSGTSAITNFVVYIEIKNMAGTYWLHAQESTKLSTSDAHWDTTQQFIRPTGEAPPGITEWATFKREVPGLPVDGPYVINIYSPDVYSPAVYFCLRNIKFFTYSTVLSLKSEKRMRPVIRRINTWHASFYAPVPEAYWTFPSEPVTAFTDEYAATNNINGNDIEGEVILGDVIDIDMDNKHEQFAGALAYAVTNALQRVDDITLTTDNGTGEALITCNGYSETAVWNTSLAQTATDFITAHNADFPGVTVSSGGSDVIRFTHNTAGVEFTGETTIVNTVFDLTGYVTNYQPDLFAMSSIATTSSWSTGHGGSGGESLPLLQLIANEIAAMYARPKELIQMPIMEIAKALQINIIANFQHAVNLYSGAIRIFCMTRGEFDVRNRQWMIDLFEIGTGAVPSGGGSTTADSTTTTADSTLITADTTI